MIKNNTIEDRQQTKKSSKHAFSGVCGVSDDINDIHCISNGISGISGVSDGCRGVADSVSDDINILLNKVISMASSQQLNSSSQVINQKYLTCSNKAHYLLLSLWIAL